MVMIENVGDVDECVKEGGKRGQAATILCPAFPIGRKHSCLRHWQSRCCEIKCPRRKSWLAPSRSSGEPAPVKFQVETAGAIAVEERVQQHTGKDNVLY